MEEKQKFLQTEASLLKAKFKRLPEFDQRVYEHGSVFVGVNASASGLMANSLFRKVMNVRQGSLLSSVLVVSFPFFQTTIFYDGFITKALMAGHRLSHTRSVVQGMCIATIVGGLTAISFAAVINTVYATKYDTMPLPNSVFRFGVSIFKPVLARMKYFLLFQTAFGAFLGSTHYTIYEKMVQMPPFPVDLEQMKK